MKYTVKNPKIVMTQDDVTFEFSAEQTEIEVSCFESTSLIDSFKNLLQEIINASNSKPKKKEENNG